ncbi:MAG: tyrosine-type recombinase/integrase, partial [Desulfovermiculus sp.]
AGNSEKNHLRRRMGQSDFVFESRNGGQMGEISSAYFRAAEKLGLNTDQSGNTIQDKRKRVDFHCLRHTYASWLAIDGTPLYTIKNLLGHSSITMTERYAHLCPNHTREAAIKISDLWSVDDNDQENPPSLSADTESDGQL